MPVSPIDQGPRPWETRDCSSARRNLSSRSTSGPFEFASKSHKEGGEGRAKPTPVPLRANSRHSYYPYASMTKARAFLEQIPVSAADRALIAHAEKLFRI